MSSACSLPAASTRLSRNATEILTQMNNAIHVPLPSLLAIREQLLVAKQQAEGEKVVLQADVAESLHIALSGFARLRERTRELRGDVKEYMLKSEDRTRQLRSKNYKLLSQLEDERSARRSRTLSDRADARSALGAEAEGLRSANAELMRRAAALEDKLRQLGCDDMVDGDAGGTGGGSSEAGSTKGGSLEPVEARMNAFSRRIATIVDAEATTSDDLASQSAALDQEMQLLKRQLAEVEVHRARVDADLELKQAEEEKERRAANPLDTQSSMMSYLYSMLTPIKPAPKPLVGGEETLTMMLVDTKMQLAEAQDEVMRLKRELKRCAAENESCSHKIVELEDKLGKAVERAQAAEARAEDAEETTRVTRIALKLCQSGPEPNGDYKLRTGCSSTHPADIDTGIYLQQSLDIGADPGFAEACRRLSPASSVCGDGGDAAEEGGGGEAAPPSKHPHTHPNLCILDAPLAAMPLSKVHDQLLSVQSYATNSHESTTSTKDASGDATVPAEVSAYPARRNTACLGR